MRVLDLMELEIKTVVSRHVGSGDLNSSLLEEQPELLTTEPAPVHFFPSPGDQVSDRNN